MMRLRVARHCQNLATMQHFYQELLELDHLGSFQNHQGYDGLFLGPNQGHWHLEFTCSDEPPEHTADEDDLLVLFFDKQQHLQHILQKLKQAGIQEEKAKNPYWNDKATLIKDPEGFGVILCYRPMP